jgi:NAD(P)H-dependent FMN reductase
MMAAIRARTDGSKYACQREGRIESVCAPKEPRTKSQNPFVWTNIAEQILESIGAINERINCTGTLARIAAGGNCVPDSRRHLLSNKGF